MNIHICAPEPTKRFTIKRECPDCKRPTLMIGVSYEWYGPSVTCIRCGRRWEGGEWMPLGFYRGSRRDNIRSAKKAYRSSHA